jgi:cell division GTPase FtsZ
MEKVNVEDTNNIINTKTIEEIAKENEEFEKALRKPRVKKQKEEEMPIVLEDNGPDRSVSIGVIGLGQCGSKICEEFYNRGYNAVAINTATQDLKCINIPEKQKLFLDFALGGSAKDREIGKTAIEQYEEVISSFLEDNLSDSSVLLLAVGGGGGTGSGGAKRVTELMSKLGKPISVLYVLPMASEDVLSKHNALCTLSEMAQLAKDDVINSLAIVDNSKIELMMPGLPMSEFWKKANAAIVDPLHLFNTLSVMPSEYVALDSMDLSRVFIGTGDCVLYGMLELEEYMESTAVAEAMVKNLQNGLLSDNFDLKQTRSAGVIITGSAAVLKKIPASNLEYGFAMLSKICNESVRIFRGVYEVPSKDDKLRIYSFFSGLGLPESRVTELKQETEKHMEGLKNKEDNRATSMKIDLGKTETTSTVDNMYNKISSKNSAMNKLTQNARKVIDKRRR